MSRKNLPDSHKALLYLMVPPPPRLAVNWRGNHQVKLTTSSVMSQMLQSERMRRRKEKEQTGNNINIFSFMFQYKVPLM